MGFRNTAAIKNTSIWKQWNKVEWKHQTKSTVISWSPYMGVYMHERLHLRKRLHQGSMDSLLRHLNCVMILPTRISWLAWDLLMVLPSLCDCTSPQLASIEQLSALTCTQLKCGGTEKMWEGMSSAIFTVAHLKHVQVYRCFTSFVLNLFSI